MGHGHLLRLALGAVVVWTIAPASAQPAPGAPATPPPTGIAGGELPPAPTAAEEDVLSRHVSFDQLTGMTKGAVTAIVQDSTGFIWFGTEEGISRFNGYEFVNYAAGSKDTLSSFTVNALATGKDELWIGTVEGLNRLDLKTNKFSHLKADGKPTSISSDFIVSLHLGKSGLLWIGTGETGVDSLNPATGEVRHFRSAADRPSTLSSDAISAVFEDKSGKVWIGTSEAGLNELDPASGNVVRYLNDPAKASSLSNDSVTTIFQDKAGVLWVGTVDGLNQFDPATRTFKRYFQDPDPKWISSITEGADGGLWIGIKSIGVYRLDRETRGVEKYLPNPTDATSLGGVWTRAAFSDAGGVLWFGFNSGAASKLNLMRRHFGFYRTHPGLSFLEDGDQVWVGTHGHGLRALDLKTGTVKRYLDEQLSSTWTMQIIAGDKKSLWLATTDRGLFRFTPSTGEVKAYDTDNGLLKSNSVFALLRDGGTLWIGSGAGLGRFDVAKNTVEYYVNDPANPATISSDFVVALAPDRARADVLWVGTAEGLNQLDKRSKQVVRFRHDPAKPNSLSHDHITAIHEDKRGQLWIGTWGGGLNLLDRASGAFSAFNTSHGLPSNVVFGILEDSTGALWLTTDNGLTKFDPASKSFITFREGDGLQDDSFGQNTYHRGASGRFYIGGRRGFNIFVPEQIKPDPYVPPVVVTKFEVLGQQRPIPETLGLSFRDRWFSIEFAALAYAAPNRNRYKYRLEGFHDWIETDRRFVSYASLPPGNYALEVVGSNAHGVWNQKSVRLPIVVNPPPWRTWWAYTLYGVFVVMVGGVFVLRQRKQLAQLRQTHRLSELEREMALTSAVQEGFFPPEPSVDDGIVRIEGFYRAASQCSGDWWWYEVRDDSYFILVGDVTGHGAGSAMVTAAAAACFRSLSARVDDETRLREINAEVLRVSRGEYHMTVTAITLEIATGKFTLRSAGGVPAFSLTADGQIRVHMAPGRPLGSAEYQVGVLEGTLEPGERMLITTDGLPEVATANKQLLGPRGISSFYVQTRDHELRDALGHLIKSVEGVQDGAQDDDWTAVMVEWGSAQAVKPAA